MSRMEKVMCSQNLGRPWITHPRKCEWSGVALLGLLQGLGLRVWGLRFRALRFRHWGLGFIVDGLWLKDRGLDLRFQDL